MLCAGVYGIGTMSLVGIDTTGLMMTLGNSALGPALKFGVAFPVVYHYICGVRHVIWDKSKCPAFTLADGLDLGFLYIPSR